MRLLKISIQVLGIMYITSNDKSNTFLSVSINNDSISQTKHSILGLFINCTFFVIYKYALHYRRCFLKLFMQLYLGILHRSCILPHVSVRSIVLNSSFSELIYISSSSKYLGVLCTFRWKNKRLHCRCFFNHIWNKLIFQVIITFRSMIRKLIHFSEWGCQ